jgi:hypothetical protein
LKVEPEVKVEPKPEEPKAEPEVKAEPKPEEPNPASDQPPT